MNTIKKEILKIKPDAHVKIIKRFTPGFMSIIFKFKPNVILTFPFTAVGLSSKFHIIKWIFKSKIICLRAEGIVGCDSQDTVNFITGFDTYSQNLVDYELFWGSKTAALIGKNLFEQKKIVSCSRSKIVGYPRLEHYFQDNNAGSMDCLPERIVEKISKYPKEKTLFFISGFHLANYTKQDLFDAKDLDAKNRLPDLLEDVEKAKRFRKDWTQAIIKSADENRDFLFIAKKHPIEHQKDYDVFNSIDNILYIHEYVEIQHIIKYVSLFFHYGSTAGADAYIAKVPVIYVCPGEEIIWYSNLGWPSEREISVHNIYKIIAEYKANKIPFENSTKIKNVLKENFNIIEGRPYQPSKKIAEYITSDEEPLRITIKDWYLLKSIVFFFYQPIINTTRRFSCKIKKITALWI